MAEHTLSPTPLSPHLGRRAALLAGGASAAGIVAGVAAAAPTVSPDAELLALRARLDGAVREMAAANAAGGIDEDHMAQLCEQLVDASWAIVDAPPAQTAEGRALKAAAAMASLRDAYAGHHWPGDGEELAWNVLSELAGDVYVAPGSRSEPGRG